MASRKRELRRQIQELPISPSLAAAYDEIEDEIEKKSVSFYDLDARDGLDQGQSHSKRKRR
jgi:hypothetical protein